ncbi:hypothetical protein PR048_032056 [Dryococelus australis]|uniref:Uncharacterized protein n=1 Tax=Dryococelus australis TaxID=614101 RepID=A0ABQ9G152_9NEOP|nr:hypothetical protein PR048_032056 [Dryococelus australis]
MTPASLAAVGIHWTLDSQRGNQEAASASFQEEGRVRWVSDNGAGQLSRRQLQHDIPYDSEQLPALSVPHRLSFTLLKLETKRDILWKSLALEKCSPLGAQCSKELLEKVDSYKTGELYGVGAGPTIEVKSVQTEFTETLLPSLENIEVTGLSPHERHISQTRHDGSEPGNKVCVQNTMAGGRQTQVQTVSEPPLDVADCPKWTRTRDTSARLASVHDFANTGTPKLEAWKGVATAIATKEFADCAAYIWSGRFWRAYIWPGRFWRAYIWPGRFWRDLERFDPRLSRFRIDPRLSRFRIFVCGNRAGRCRWSMGFLGGIQFLPPFRSRAAPHSPRFTLAGSEDLNLTPMPYPGFEPRTSHTPDRWRTNRLRRRSPISTRTVTRTLVQSLAHRSDVGLGACVNVVIIAPALLYLKRATNRQTAPLNGQDGSRLAPISPDRRMDKVTKPQDYTTRYFVAEETSTYVGHSQTVWGVLAVFEEIRLFNSIRRRSKKMPISRHFKTRKERGARESVHELHNGINQAQLLFQKLTVCHDTFGEYLNMKLLYIKYENIRRRLNSTIRRAVIDAIDEDNNTLVHSSWSSLSQTKGVSPDRGLSVLAIALHFNPYWTSRTPATMAYSSRIVHRVIMLKLSRSSSRNNSGEFQRLLWPPRSIDMNPTEHVRDVV